jgi:hypothetical protein
VRLDTLFDVNGKEGKFWRIRGAGR